MYGRLPNVMTKKQLIKRIQTVYGTQTAFARVLRISKGYLNQIIHGEEDCPPRIAWKIVKKLGFDDIEDVFLKETKERAYYKVKQ